MLISCSKQSIDPEHNNLVGIWENHAANNIDAEAFVTLNLSKSMQFEHVYKIYSGPYHNLHLHFKTSYKGKFSIVEDSLILIGNKKEYVNYDHGDTDKDAKYQDLEESYKITYLYSLLNDTLTITTTDINSLSHQSHINSYKFYRK